MNNCCPECNKTMGFPASFIAGFCPSCAGKYITQQAKRIEELEGVRAGVRVSLIAMRTAVKKGGCVSEEQLKDLIDELTFK